MKKKLVRVINSARRDPDDRFTFGIVMMVFALGAMVGLALAATK